MATPGRTQKQIAERYKGNLGYYKRKHPWRVARFCATFVAVVGGIAAIVVFQKRGREEFFSAGRISSNHANFAEDCAQCHDKTGALGDDITLTKIKAVVKERFHRGIDFSAIDRKCEQCHQQHTLHEPNVVENRSCSACHQEHQGPGPMRLVADSQCASCHNDSGVMAASAQKGMQLSPAAFHLRARPAQQVVFELPRPARGYTQVFSSFAKGHPPFQLESEKMRDPDVLRFNHQRHEAADIPLLNGRKLDCNFCHKPDVDGRYYQRINFQANCQACHSLQFDAKNPELTLPHGDPTAIRGFLRALPAQYADLAVRKGLVRPAQIQNFVAQQMTQLRERVRSGEDFERQIFFTKDPYKPQREGGTQTGGSFYGCAFCHEVKPAANRAPLITKPILVDRWMPQARFDHAKHASVKCDDCHHASQSRETSDVLMPGKASCVVCHSPQGKVVSECITCHSYHAPPQIAAADLHAEPLGSFKQMLLGSNQR
ncbi:MAG TPA: cytochrome c3 family protein [Chthoniobacterales bacterium]|jgi:predicted CXXCH cytochrome family protein